MSLIKLSVPSDKLLKFVNGNNVNLNPNDMKEVPINIAFKTKKTMNRLLRNFHKGSGFILKRDDVSDIFDTDGGSIFTSGLKTLKKAFTNIGDGYKETVGLNPFQLGYDLGHDKIAPALKSAIRKSGGKLTAKKIGKQLEKAFNIGSKAVKKETKKVIANNKDALKALGSELTQAALESAFNEEGADFKSTAKSVGQRAKHTILKDLTERNGLVDSYQHGQFKPKQIMETIENGAGMKTDYNGGYGTIENPFINGRKIRKPKDTGVKLTGSGVRPIGGAIRSMHSKA